MGCREVILKPPETPSQTGRSSGPSRAIFSWKLRHRQEEALGPSGAIFSWTAQGMGVSSPCKSASPQTPTPGGMAERWPSPATCRAQDGPSETQGAPVPACGPDSDRHVAITTLDAHRGREPLHSLHKGRGGPAL